VGELAKGSECGDSLRRPTYMGGDAQKDGPGNRSPRGAFISVRTEKAEDGHSVDKATARRPSEPLRKFPATRKL
jgi:hypothetical protein